MSDPRIDRYNTALAKFSAVLHEVWTPIDFGGLPRDEYETYAVRCLSLLASGASKTELVAYLVSAGGALADEPEAHAKRSAEAAHQLMKYKGEIGAIALDLSIDADPQQQEAASPLVLMARSTSR